MDSDLESLEEAVLSSDDFYEQTVPPDAPAGTQSRDTPALQPTDSPHPPPPSKKPKSSKSGKSQKPPIKQNTSIYVSRLPSTTSLDKLAEYFGKAGVIMTDMFTGGPRIKIYRNGGEDRGTDESDEKRPGNAALIVYLRSESVKLAIDLLDETVLDGSTIRVEEASFEHQPRKDDGAAGQEAEAQPSKPTVPSTGATHEPAAHKIDKKQWTRQMAQMKKSLEWSSEDLDITSVRAAPVVILTREEKIKHDWARIVCLDGMISRGDRNKEGEGEGAEGHQDRGEPLKMSSDRVTELLNDIKQECTRLSLPPASVQLNRLGIISCRYKDPKTALILVNLMNGRRYDGSTIRAWLYDGKERLEEYKGGQEEEEARIERFGDWLERDDEEDGGQELLPERDDDQSTGSQQSFDELDRELHHGSRKF